MNHKDLDVYKESMTLVTMIYQLAKQLPDDERYGLTSQIKRAAVSIPSNIAEGSARKSTKELIQFLYISLGSLAEVETQLDIAYQLKYIEESAELNNKIHQVFVLITKLISTLQKKLR
jgi:four helix bundle protein